MFFSLPDVLPQDKFTSFFLSVELTAFVLSFLINPVPFSVYSLLFLSSRWSISIAGWDVSLRLTSYHSKCFLL